jgi:coenzyme PQQ biosynthesis protein PqqD
VSEIADDARPRLARKARLRFDRRRGQHMLLYPERGMALSASAAAIAELCTGELTVREIAARLAAANSGASPQQIASDVRGFLSALAERALVEWS